MPNEINWPSKSLDLNPIENIWKLLKQRVRKRLPQTLDKFEDIFHEEWNNLSNNIVINIYESFPRRIEQCI